MAELTVPKVDFSSLGDLPKIYKAAQKERTLADLGKGLADGSIDYKQAGATLASLGDIGTGLSLMKLGEEEKASAEFSKTIGSMYSPGQQPMPQTRQQPVTQPAASPSFITPTNEPIQPPPRPEVAPTSRVWGDKEAEEAGLYEKPVKLASLGSPEVPRSNPAPVAPPEPAPVKVAQAPQTQPAQALPVALMQDPSTAKIGQLLAASVNPRLPASQKEVAKTLLAHALKASELTSDQKEYLGAVAQGETASFTDWTRGNKGASATRISIDQKGEAKFDEEFGKKQADRWNKYIENADAAERKLVDINTMREIHQRAGSQGIGANIKEAIGPYAEALGVNIKGLDDVQAYSQVIQRLAPQQRAPGSGSTSDIEFKGFLKSLPGLSQNPAAREVGLNTMEALARDEIARGAIARDLAQGDIKRGDAEKRMRALPDPMKGFVEWRKANPDLYGQSLKLGAAPATSTQPKDQERKPTMPDGKIAPDGKEYVPDPARPGKYLMVQ